MTVLSDRVDALEATNANLVSILNGLQSTLQSVVDAGQGVAGWSPELTVESDGARRVLQVTDWTGGGGTKPATGDYVGASGLVSDIANAIDIRGDTGATGDSAYDEWLALGNTGTEQDFIDDVSAQAVSATSANVTAAQAAEDKAEKWAEEVEDTPVEAGKYSALHHSAKAADSATAASTSESNAASSETAAATSETNAAVSEAAAATSEANAASSASAASTSESNAAASASAAATSETNAAASASAAATSETNAAASESAALGYKNTTQTLRDDVLERFIGNYADDAGANTSGYTISEGVFYWNTTSKGLRIYDGASWSAAVLDTAGALVAANNLSDLNDAATARTNLGLGSAATSASSDYATATQGSKADSAQQPPSEGAFVDGDKTKLDGIEAGATADQTAGEIKTAYESNADTNPYTDAEKTKLSGIEAGADATDAANVQLAGALMDSEVTNLADVKAFDSADYATAAQGSKADSATQPGDLATVATTGAYSDLSGTPSIPVSGTDFVDKSGGTFTGAIQLDAGAGEPAVAMPADDIDMANGGVQTRTLTSNTTFTESLADGDSVLLHLADGDTYTVTWPTMTWVGGSAPTLTADDVIVIWQRDSTVYGQYVGSVA